IPTALQVNKAEEEWVTRPCQDIPRSRGDLGRFPHSRRVVPCVTPCGIPVGLQVNEAEEERVRSEREHQRVTRLCQEAEAEVQALQKSLKRVILRSKPYFELKAQFNQILEEHKSKVTALESRVSQAKTRYSVALRNLEQISEQIHARRLQRLLQRRESPVGAESSPRHSSPESRGADLGAECPAGDSLSVLSLQTVASDLQKFDSVEHLVGISDAASLGSDEPGERERRRSLRHHRSVSL
ncbi:SH3 domain-binding protein 5-like, partial [Corapipo altera]|uniref:SH3 domain-binding protein 5-like n=1 Tax=Corapipo altera TaxID=415028 RepID=UPI000FD65527